MEKELEDMVTQINQTEVALEERLSNHVYYYDKEKRELRMATGQPVKNMEAPEETVTRKEKDGSMHRMGR